MTFRHEWQLVSHKPKLSQAEALVALAIARRIPQGANSVRIPIRTLTAESVGLTSRNTIAKAKEGLERKGVIRITSKNGARRAHLIEWTLTCPDDCTQNHSEGNKRLSDTLTGRALEPKQPTPTRSQDEHNMHTTEDALRINKNERDYLELVRTFLTELSNPTQAHLDLLAKLDNPQEAREVGVLASYVIQGADTSAHNYLKKVVTSSPLRLMPRALKAAKTPEELALKEIAEAKRAKELERTRAYLEEMEERQRQAAPPPKCQHGNNIALCKSCISAISV